MSIFDVYNRLRSEIRSRVSPYLQRRYSSSTSPTVRSRSNVISSIPVVRDVHARFIQGVHTGYRPDVHSSPPVEVDTQKLTPFHQYRTVSFSQGLDQTSVFFHEKIRQLTGDGNKPVVLPPTQHLQRHEHQIYTHMLHGAASVPQIIGDVVRGGEMFARIPGEAGLEIIRTGDVARGREMFVRDATTVAQMSQYGIGIMAGGMAEGFRNRPIQTAGEMTGQMLVFGGIGRGGRYPIKRVMGNKGKPLITQNFIPQKPFVEMKTPEGLIPGKKIKFESGAEVATALEKVKSPIKEPLDFTQIKSLPGDKGLKIESWIRSHPEQQPVVGGSTAAKTQFRLARKPGDIDLNVQNVKASGTDIYNTMFKDMGTEKARSRYELKHDRYLIQTKTEGKWHDAVDIHPTVPKGSSLRFGFKTQNPIEIGGIKYKPAGELIQRKAESVLLPQKGGTIGPRSFRMKDVGDFEKYALDALKSQREQVQNVLFFKGYRQKKVGHIESKLSEYKFHSYFGPDIYMVRGAAKAYADLPFSTKVPMSFVAAGSSAVRSPGYVPLRSPGYEPLRSPGYEPLRSPGYEPLRSPGYEPPRSSGYKPPGYPSYEPLRSSGYEPPRSPGYEPLRSPGYVLPGYEPSDYVPSGYEPSDYVPSGYEPSDYVPSGYVPSDYVPSGYEPSDYVPSGYEPSDYVPPDYVPPGYELPVYPQPGKPKSPFDFDFKEEFIPRKKKKSSSKESETFPWFPAGLGRVTLEESMTGLPALHIADPGKTRALHQKYKLTGKEIPTLRQIKIGGM